MITANVYNRVFFIRASSYGTAFTIDVDKKQYLVTAKHLFDDIQNVDAISLFHDKQWKNVKVTVVGACRGEADIIVLKTDLLLSPPMELAPTTAGMVLGQDVYFVGFPYMMHGDLGEALNGRPAPFIKKGTLSSAFNAGDEARLMFIDAINNNGFSGGPVVFQPPGQRDFQVAGVVSGFKTEREPVMSENGEITGMYVEYNTGFLRAYGIENALDIINRNPGGHPIKDAPPPN